MRPSLFRFLISAAIFAAGPAWADDRALGLSLARDGRCEGALEVLLPLRTQPPRDAEVERLSGECALRLSRFELAVEALEAARALEPGAPDIELRLAQALYHAGRRDDAGAALERVPAGERGRAEWLLYSGLVAFDRGEMTRAAEQLGAAVALKDPSIEPTASFYLGRVHQRRDDRERARASFDHVVDGWSDTAWAEQASRSLEALDDAESIPVWASAELGFEADDNALLRGRGVGRPSEISGQSDVRGYWFVDTGALWLRQGAWSAGTTLRYGGSENRHLGRFDTQAPGATAWLDRDLGWQQASLRLQYDFDATWIGSTQNPFLLSHLLTTSLFKPWKSGFTTLGGALALDDYGYSRGKLDVTDIDQAPPDPDCGLCSPAGVREIGDTNRDGLGPIVSLVHRQSLPEPNVGGFQLPWIEGGYRYQLYVSKGREYDHQRHQLELAAGIRLPLAVDLSVRGRYAYVPYAHRSVFPNPKNVVDDGSAYFLDPSDRHEHETGVRVQLQRAFGEHVLVTARWSRTRNRSTSDVFDYTRDLFGFSVRIGWGG